MIKFTNFLFLFLILTTQNIIAKESIISRIQFTGNQAILSADLDKKLTSFIGKVITQERLENIRATVFDTYSQKGYFTRVELPEQDLSEGIVRLRIIEVSLGKINIIAPENLRFGSESAQKYFQIPLAGVQPLSVEMLDETTKLLDNLAGISAETKIIPGGEGEQVDLNVEMNNTDFSEMSLQTDNLGAKSTGRQRYTADLQFNSALSLGEKTVISAIKSERLLSLSIDLEVPVGVYGARGVIGAERSTYDVDAGSGNTIDGISPKYWARYRFPSAELLEMPLNIEMGFEHTKTEDTLTTGSQINNKTNKKLYINGSMSWFNAVSSSAGVISLK